MNTRLAITILTGSFAALLTVADTLFIAWCGGYEFSRGETGGFLAFLCCLEVGIAGAISGVIYANPKP